MPQFFENAVMTNAGAALLARSMAEGITIDFLSIAVGSGSYTPAEKSVASLQQRTALKNLQVEYEPMSVIHDSDKSVRISALITNVDPVSHEAIVTSGFYINEIGIMAQPSDEATGPILFSVSVTAGTQGDYMPAYTGDNPAQIVQGYVTAINNNATVTLTAPVNPYALAADLQELADSMDNRITQLNAVDNDLKFLGWSVPRECPIQNYMDSNRVFHQRVGRVDLGSFTWVDNGSDNLYYTNQIASSNNPPKSPKALGYYLKGRVVDNLPSSDWELQIRSTQFSSISYVKKTNSSASQIKTELSGVYLYYELATEILHNEGGEIGESIGGLGNAIGMRGWNQTLNSKTLETDDQTISGVHFTVNSNGSITISGTATAKIVAYFHNRRHEPLINGHKYLFSVSSQHKNVYFFDAYANLWNTATAQIITYNNQTCICALLIYASYSVNATIYPMCIDLTALFGAGNEPASVENFRAMFHADYYPYCSGGFGDLLWTNASPTSAFAEQEIMLSSNSTDYSALLFEFKENTNGTAPVITIIKKIKSASAEDGVVYCGTATNSWRNYIVNYGNNPKDISVSRGRYATTYAGSGADDNNRLIPINIYGIK